MVSIMFLKDCSFVFLSVLDKFGILLETHISTATIYFSACLLIVNVSHAHSSSCYISHGNILFSHCNCKFLNVEYNIYCRRGYICHGISFSILTQVFSHQILWLFQDNCIYFGVQELSVNIVIFFVGGWGRVVTIISVFIQFNSNPVYRVQ